MSSWKCTCGTMNTPNDQVCTACGTTRVSSVAKAPPGSGPGAPEPWRCGACETVNSGALSTCSACSAAKPLGDRPMARVGEVTGVVAASSLPSMPAGTGGVASDRGRSGRRSNGLLIGALVAAVVVAGVLAVLLVGRHPITPVGTTRSTGTRATVPATTPSPASTSTPTPTVPPTAATAPPVTSSPVVVTSEMQSWPNDPNKCGASPTDTGQPFSSSLTYQVTATIHIWSSPSTSSTPLAIIPVSQYGPGGAGCPTASDPVVAVTCKTQGDSITGPFSSDPIWERATWNGTTGYVPDEWVNTQWDASDGGAIPGC